jgi:hypothetical protein
VATRRIYFRNLNPDNSGNAYPKPSVIDDANDLFPHELVALKDGGDGAAIVDIEVPSNYVGSPKWYVLWRSPATTGAARFTVSYYLVAPGGGGDPSAATETLAAVDASADGTARDFSEHDLGAATAGNFAINRIGWAKLLRSGGHANDDMAAEALIEALILEYADA